MSWARRSRSNVCRSESSGSHRLASSARTSARHSMSRFRSARSRSILRRDRLDQRNWWWLNVMGRLKPGQTAEVAATGLARLQPTMRDLTRPAGGEARRSVELSEYPNRRRARASVEPRPFRDTYRQALTALMGIVGLVLLIACVNVANLLLARAERRRAGVSLQLALGASRLGLVRQSLLESLVLSTVGAAGGTRDRAMGRHSGSSPIAVGDRSVVPGRVARLARHRLHDGARHGGRDPVRHCPGAPRDARRSDGRVERSTWDEWNGHGVGSETCSWRVQFALCLVLVVAAGLFVRTFTSLVGRDTGVDRDRVLIVEHRRETQPARVSRTWARAVQNGSSTLCGRCRESQRPRSRP